MYTGALVVSLFFAKVAFGFICAVWQLMAISFVSQTIITSIAL